MGRVLVALALIGLATAGAAEAKQASLPGKVTVSDGKVIPPGAILKVSLRDLTMGVAKAATVAQASFEADGRPPLRFELPYTETSIEPKRLYGVSAVIADSRGKALWETRVPIRVLTLGNQKKVELLLRPASVPKTPAPDPTAFSLECGTARFDVTLADRAATIVGDNSKIVLPRVNAPAGKKFSDGASMLSVYGEAIYLQLPERAYRDCKMTAHH
jgi:putative lipoprotein